MTKVIVNSSGNFRVGLNDQQRAAVRTVSVAPSIPTNSLLNLEDVDTSGLSNNDTLVYNSNTGKFETKEIEVISGGSF
jgi:sorbitol-specific phosphotransferase system component IIBC